MSQEELKKNIHTLVESCEDENLLEGVLKILNAIQKPDEPDWWSDLSETDKQRLEESYTQYEKGKVKAHKDVMKKAATWLKK